MRGGYGGQNQKNHWRIIFGPKVMILQGVRRQKPYNGVCYANDPKKGGVYPLTPALDLTTSLRGDFVATNICPTLFNQKTMDRMAEGFLRCTGVHGCGCGCGTTCSLKHTNICK